MKNLATKSLWGPWDQLTVTFPHYDPLNKTKLNAEGNGGNMTSYFEFKSAYNESQSYLVSPGGRILRRLWN